MRLNLLSQEKQHYLQRTIIAEFIKNICELALFVVCLVAIAFLGGLSILQNHFNDLAENTISVKTGVTEKNSVIRTVNARLKRAEMVQKNYRLWTPMILAIGNAVPSDVTLTRLSFDGDKKIATITGVAKTRDALLLFKTTLESLPFLSPITIPLSDLTKQEQIPFSFSPTFK